MSTIAALERHNVSPAVLLVVPGADWSSEELQTLRALQRDGYRLAGHGWTHRVERIRGFAHGLHSRLISRNIAEHLSLDGEGIARLIRRCFHWFSEHELEPPDLYVPPAWAMGRISRSQLRELPFSLFEYFGGSTTADKIDTMLCP